MISVTEAEQILSAHIRDFGTESLPLDDTRGRILRETLHADRDFPPYNRVAMDGIGIAYATYAQGAREFAIDGVAAAGSPQLTLNNSSSCFEVMTGAVLPIGCDTVIPYEEIEIATEVAKITAEVVKERQHIHAQGIDRKAGAPIVSPGRMMSPAEIGVAATIGKATLTVSKLPRTLIISTGDELVPIDQTPLPYQIRRSNMHRLKATLATYGIAADAHHFDDDAATIKQELERMLATYDVIILSGGVSKGKFDYIPGALDELGVEKLFHRIRQRPGKPIWAGKKGETYVFAMPGNPVSSFLCMKRYFEPWLHGCLQMKTQPVQKAMLAEAITFKPDLTYFMQVRLSQDEEGRLLAHPVEGHGSGDLANLVDADAFLQIPQGQDRFEAGGVYPVLPYR